MRFRRCLVAAGALALGLGACSSGSSSPSGLPTSSARPELLRWAAQKYGADATIGAVKCPQQTVPKRKGFRFVCTVDVDRVPLKIVLTETNRAGQVQWALGEALIITKKAEDAVAGFANDHGHPTRRVSCGRTTVLTRTPGQKISCRLTYADGTTGGASLGVKDLNSNVAWLGFTP